MAQIITFSVSPDGAISPSTVQKAGVQGNHNITEIRFEGASVLNGVISDTKTNKVRIQFIDGAGGFYSTGFLLIYSNDTNGRLFVTCQIPSTVTNAGGIAKVYLVVTKIVYGVEDEIAYEDQVFISSEARISFEGSGVGSPSEYQYRKGISSALVNAEIFVGQAESASGAAKEYRDSAETFCNDAGNYQSKAGMYASNAETSAKDAETYAGNAAESATSAKESKDSANHDAVSANIAASVAQSRAEEAANSLQELKDGIANGDFKGDKGDKGDPGKDAITDQTYNPESKNAQSGKAVAEAIRSSVYYHTEREEIGVQHEDINTAYIIDLYDALMAEYPNNVQKNPITSDDGTFTNYVYVISTGEYSTDGFYQHLGEADGHIKKPKYLVLNGFHGSERKTVFSTYRFVRDVLKGHNVPHAFREGVILHILPVANPTGFDAFNYEKTNGVDINNNFDWNWTESNSHGAYPASEPETQAITKWLTDNRDAKLFIDFHNSGKVNENVAIIGTPDNEDAERVKRTALRGVDRVISYWRDVIGYPPVNAPYWNEDGTALEKDANGDLALKETPVLFSYSASMIAEGHAFGYAQSVLGIPAFVMETSSYYGDYDEWKANETTYPAETIAMGAEALGNILIEYFSETSEVIDMSEVNDKLDTILQGVSFREVKGQLVVNATTGADIIYADGTVDAAIGDLIPVEGKTSLKVKFPIPNGARIVCIKADAETENAIKTTQTPYFVQATVDFGPIGYLIMENLFPITIWGYNDATSKWNYVRGITKCYNTDGFTLDVFRLKAGTYNYTAYYWND